jgi:centrin-3
MFNLYCDNRRHCDVSDILNTARTLGFDRKFKLIFDALTGVNKDLAGEWVDFETFLHLITEKIGSPFNEAGRRAMFALVDPDQKEILDVEDLRRISEQLKYNLTEDDIKEVVNNVAGFGKREITWDQFNKYIAKKADKKGNAAH